MNNSVTNAQIYLGKLLSAKFKFYEDIPRSENIFCQQEKNFNR